MFIAITGVPGSGKTVLSVLLKARGFIVLSDKFFYEKLRKDLVLEEDKTLETKIIDINKWNLLLNKVKYIWKGKILFIESHMSHLLDVDFVIVLERELKELKQEYLKRGYNKTKIKDNLEAQIFRICYLESIEKVGSRRVKIFNKYWKAYYFLIKLLPINSKYNLLKNRRGKSGLTKHLKF